MGVVSFPQVTSGLTIDQLADLVARMIKEVEWLANGNVDSHNVRNLAGFNVDRYLFKHESGIVGLSGADPTNPAAIRIWAGLADMTTAPFRVSQDGSVFGSNMTIQGGVIRTNPVGQARIELSGNTLTTYTTGNIIQGIQWGQGFSGSTYGDVGFFDSGVETFRIENRTAGGGWVLKPMGSSGMGVGWSGNTTQAHGDWVFDGSVNLGSQTATGKVQYAGQADSALSASSAQSVDWANVTNHPDGTTTPIMNGVGGVGTSTLYSRQDHVHPSDTSRQATITGAATTITASNLTVSRALSSDASGKVAVSAVTSTEQGYLSGVTSAIQTQLNAKGDKSPTVTWIAPTLLNSWVNYNTTSFDAAGYYKDQFGYVHLRGMISTGTTTVGTVILNLPAGYRPFKNKYFTTVSNSAACTVAVVSSGDLQVAGSVSSLWLSLDSIPPFLAEQ